MARQTTHDHTPAPAKRPAEPGPGLAEGQALPVLDADPTVENILALQHAVGNQSVQRRLAPALQRAPAGTPGARPTARRGHSGEHVGVLQQKLNAARAVTPALVVDAQFGPLTNDAVIAYQTSKGLGRDGVVGPLTWAALDADAPSGGRDAAGAETHVNSP
ncbi:MAG: peptidoglycan-binding protein, partial [Anaerolineales bacterium]|nr:peptidoglycan-binding protein [Anaerolineales bacterium]